MGILNCICVCSVFDLNLGVFGSVSEYVSGEGLLVSGENSIYSISTPTGAHNLKEMKIKQGDTIKAGQTVALFNSPDLNLKVTALKEKLDYFNTTLSDYQKTYSQELTERQGFLTEQRKILDRVVKHETDNIKQIEEILASFGTLGGKGLIRNVDKRYHQQQLADAQRALEYSHTQLISNQVSFSAFQDQWKERIRNLEIKVKEIELDLKDSEEKLENATEVKSHVSGKVIYIHKNEGDSVKDGESVATVTAYEDEIKAADVLKTLDMVSLKSGLRYQKLPLHGQEWWLKDLGPLLVFDSQQDRYLTLLPQSSGGYSVHDQPDILINEKFATQLDNTGYVFFLPLPEDKTSLWEVFKLSIHPTKKEIISVCCSQFLIAILGLLTPVFFGMIVDYAINLSDRGILGQIIYGLIVATVCVIMLNILQAIALLRLRLISSSFVQAALWDRLVRLPLSFYRLFGVGELMWEN